VAPSSTTGTARRADPVASRGPPGLACSTKPDAAVPPAWSVTDSVAAGLAVPRVSTATAVRTEARPTETTGATKVCDQGGEVSVTSCPSKTSLTDATPAWAEACTVTGIAAPAP